MLGQIAPSQDTGVYLRLQCLHAPVQHLGEAGVIGHLGARHAVVGQQFGSAASGQDLHAEVVQALGKFEDAGFIRDADECLSNGHLFSFVDYLIR